MTKLEILNKVLINENLYIYKKQSGKFLSKKTVTDVFALAINDKADQQCKKLLTIINQTVMVRSNRKYRFSALFLKYSNVPSFLPEYIDQNWMEQKLAYMLVYDFSNYLIVVKRNISGIQDFINYFEELEYEVIAKVLVTADTLFEKFSAQNLDIAKESMKTQQVESDNLSGNFNYLGANTYALNLMRLNNNSQRYLVSLKSSRISKAGDKKSVANIADWAAELIMRIENFQNSKSFLDVFATPSSYVKVRDELEPISVTLLLNTLINDLITSKIIEVIYERNGLKRKINLSKFITDSNVSVELGKENVYLYEALNDSFYAALQKLRIKLNPKTITLFSGALAKFKLLKDTGAVVTLTEYFNSTKSFVVNFEDCEYVYSNGTLFKDSQLLGNIELFLEVFVPDQALALITSEKGRPTVHSTGFDSDCTFGYVEALYNHAKYLMLDDLGDEWADHIYLDDQQIVFIHSKHSDKIFSATAFTDIVGQAQKNFGNLLAADDRIQAKLTHWSNTFVLDNVISRIPRLRKGASVNEFIDKYLEVKKGINLRRKIVLVLDFISLNDLTVNLNLLKSGTAFNKRKQTIQILWFLSSLIGNCRANSIAIEIRCKP